MIDETKLKELESKENVLYQKLCEIKIQYDTARAIWCETYEELRKEKLTLQILEDHKQEKDSQP